MNWKHSTLKFTKFKALNIQAITIMVHGFNTRLSRIINDYLFTQQTAKKTMFTYSCIFAITTPCDACGSIARFIYELRGCNLYGVAARVVITGLEIVMR